jgi:hypothetical protein
MRLSLSKFNALNFISIVLFLLLAGRFYQFAFLEPPFRAFMLNTNFMAPFIEGVLGIEWFDWVTNPKYERRVNLMLDVFAWILGFMTLSVMLFKVKFFSKIVPYLMIPAALILLITSFGYYWDKSTQIGQFWEYSLQFGLPIIFLLLLKNKDKSASFLAKAFCSLTFAAHGLYAIGFYPIPGEFVHMSSRLLSITDEPAKQFLFVAGVLDFVFAIGLWIPKIQKPVLLYGALWGFATALARLIGFYYSNVALISLHQGVFEFLVRIPHGAIPLWLFIKALSPKDISLINSFLTKLKPKTNKNEIPKSI